MFKSDMGENYQPMNPANSGSFHFFRPVSELIKGPIQSIGPETTASDCAKKMSEASIGSLSRNEGYLDVV